MHYTTNLLMAPLGRWRRAGDQPPDAEPSTRKPTTVEEEKTTALLKEIRGENLNKRSDGEKKHKCSILYQQLC
jgi:hypothetical protein